MIVVSTELDEVVALADRIAVMYRGAHRRHRPGDTPRDVLGLMMAGETPDGRGGRVTDEQIPDRAGPEPLDSSRAQAPLTRARRAPTCAEVAGPPPRRTASCARSPAAAP